MVIIPDPLYGVVPPLPVMVIVPLVPPLHDTGVDVPELVSKAGCDTEIVDVDVQPLASVMV